MKKKSSKNDLRAEYDFSAMPGGIRGKYAKAYREGTNIVVLADDVAAAFPTDDSVNRALRAIMEAVQAMRAGRTPPNKAGPRTPPRRRR